MKEKCGLFGIFLQQPNYKCLYDTIKGLKLLQHRGQEGAGIAYYKENTLLCKKRIRTCRECI